MFLNFVASLIWRAAEVGVYADLAIGRAGPSKPPPRSRGLLESREDPIAIPPPARGVGARSCYMGRYRGIVGATEGRKPRVAPAIL